MSYPDPYRDDRIDIEQRAPPRFPAPEGQSWVFGAALGAGGFGRAYLWNLVNNTNQKVVDRVVLKYTEIRSEQVLHHGGPGYGEIREVFTQRHLVPNGTPPDRVFTVPLLGAEHCSWSLDSWRFYSPYYAFGDLGDLIRAQDTPGDHRQIPEPFAWYILYRLASAAVVMDEAFNTEDTKYEVVHCDFKPENIFMGAPGSLGKNNSFPAYPAAYLGDFGNAHITYPEDPRTDLMYGMCTQGWSAPEITDIGYRRAPWQAAGGSHTNIWQIGYIMQSILMGITYWHGDIQWEAYDNAYVPQYTPPPKRPHASEDENRLRRDYSPELIQILNACVQFRVESRPTPQELLAAIEESMPRYTQGMERWGTAEWFEELNSGGGDTTVDDSTVSGLESGAGSGEESELSLLQRGRRIKDATESLIDKFKHLMCFPRARRHKRRKTPTDRHLSPFSRERARAASRKRRQDMVTRQLREGLRPKYHRYVSPDPSDDIFVLDDDLKIIHPKRPTALDEYFDAPDPKPTTYREDIDDVAEYAFTKMKYERQHRDGDPDEYPAVGVRTYDFRKDGEKPGEVVWPHPAQK